VYKRQARHEPDAVAALRAGREDRMNRLLRLPLPEPYLPSRTEALRDRLRSRPGSSAPAKSPKSPKPGKSPRSPKPAKSPKSPKTAKSAKPVKRAARNAAPLRDRSRRAEAGTAHSSAQHSGHHGGASQQRRAAAAQGSERHGKRRARRSRAMEGQRHG